MAEEISNPLLSLIKEKSLIDDLQYEEVVAEFKRNGKPVIQILADFGIMDSDTTLQVMADHLGTQVVKLSDRDLPPEVIKALPASAARMYQCVPTALSNGTLQVALVDPLNPARADELGFVVKKDIQLVVADPFQIQKALEKYYPEDTQNVNDILKELGADQEIAKEVSEVEVTDDATLMDRLANQDPIMRFV